MPYIKTYFLLLAILLFSFCQKAEGAFFIKGKISIGTTIAYSSPGWNMPVHATRLDSMLKWQPRATDDTEPKKDNRRGMASLLCMGLLFTVFTAVVIITPTIPGGLTLVLCILGLASSIAAIVLGKRGVKYDRNRGYAIAGLILGYGVLSLMVFGLLILSMIGGGLGAVFL